MLASAMTNIALTPSSERFRDLTFTTMASVKWTYALKPNVDFRCDHLRLVSLRVVSASLKILQLGRRTC